MQTEEKKRPKWLRRLERESWQAELIISGAAIIGSLQLPGLLDKFQYYLLLNYEGWILKVWFMATAYWAMFVYSLILLFIMHFIIRALWIGLVGLSSIYPDGIAETDMTSQDLQDKMRAKYGDVDGFIDQLDRTASGMFGSGFTMASVFFNFGLILSLSILFISFLRYLGLPGVWPWVIGLGPVAATLVISTLSGFLNMKSMRDKAWVKRYQFPLTQILGRFTYPVNNKFVMTGMALTTSNSAPKDTPKSKVLTTFITTMAMFGFVGFLMGTSGAIKYSFIDMDYHRMGDDITGIDLKNYADTETDQLLYEPMVNTRYIDKGGPLWVWVPLPEREYGLMMNTCEEPEVDDDLPREERRKAKWARTVSCVNSYTELYLDEKPIGLPDAMREYRNSVGMEQFGVRFDLTELSPPLGAHTLRVVTHFILDEEEPDNYRTTYIQFVVVDRN